MIHSALLNVMVKAARKAARGLARDFGEVEKLQVSLKGPANFVSAADRKAEQIIKDELLQARPGYGFLGEEGGRHEGADKTHAWIVDPLDGTTNFLHGIPQFAISIALEREGAIVAGLVYNPVSDDMFLAEKGKGAFLNDQRIRVAARRKLSEAIVSCDLPHRGRVENESSYLELAAVQQQEFAALRHFGAAALDLAWIAAGRLDLYWEHNLHPWDVAAGMILVREAGGFVTDADGGEEIFAKGNILAGNAALHGELLKVLKAARKG